MSLSLQTLVLLPPKGGYHLVARQGGLVEPRNSELECSILRALERMVDAEGEQSPSFFFFFSHEGGRWFLLFQESLFQFLMRE